MWLDAKNSKPNKNGFYKTIVKCYGLENHSGVETETEWKNGWKMGDYGAEAPYYYIEKWDPTTFGKHKSKKPWLNKFTITADEAREASENKENREELEMEKYLSVANWAVRNAMRSGTFSVSPQFSWNHQVRYIRKITDTIRANGFQVDVKFEDGGKPRLTISWGR